MVCCQVTFNDGDGRERRNSHSAESCFSCKEYREKERIYFKITNARAFLPSGKSNQLIGIFPDLKISSEIDGRFPPRKREVDLWRAVYANQKEEEFHSQFNIAEIEKHIAENGTAEQQIKSLSSKSKDVFLLRAMDAFEAYLVTK